MGRRAASSSPFRKTGLTTTVGGDGTFELEGVPEGGFTLVFTRDGAVLGTIEITGASPGQEIRITVRVTGRRVALVAIEHANGDDGDAGDADDDDGGTDTSRTCAISGGKVGEGIELEGNVDSGDAAGFELRVNGNRVKNGGTVRVNTAGASFKCNGKPTATECRSTVQAFREGPREGQPQRVRRVERPRGRQPGDGPEAVARPSAWPASCFTPSCACARRRAPEPAPEE